MKLVLMLMFILSIGCTRHYKVPPGPSHTRLEVTHYEIVAGQDLNTTNIRYVLEDDKSQHYRTIQIVRK